MFQRSRTRRSRAIPGGTINEGFRSEIFPRFLDRGFIVTFDRHRVRICTDFTSGGNYNVTGAELRSSRLQGQLTRPLTGGEDPSKKSGIDPRPKIAPPKILNLSIPRYFILDGGGA